MNFASLGVDDPEVYRLDTWGVGVGDHMAYLPCKLCVIRALVDLGKSIYMRGFGYGLLEGIVSLMIPVVNPPRYRKAWHKTTKFGNIGL